MSRSRTVAWSLPQSYAVDVATHDVMTFANGLSAKLAARSRHVCVFLGAGAARACGLPDVTGLQSAILEGLEEPDRSTFSEQLSERNLEQALSRLRRIATLLSGSNDRVDGLTAEEAHTLDRKVCRLIIAALDLSAADNAPMLRLAAWAARADYHLPLELFTVNYDLLIETALEAIGVAYFDGFVGALQARFRTDLVESSPTDAEPALPAFLVRLWKLHGSVNWAWQGGERSEVVRLGGPVPDGDPAAIYPSDAKYDESRRVPFVVLQDRLRRSLNHPETLMIVSGYSFGDAHLNELLFDAARRRPRSEVIAFCFSTIPESLVDRALTTPNLQAVGADEAVLGGIRLGWEPAEHAPEDLWTGDAMRLGNFASLAGFLARSTPPQGELEARLGELLARAVPGAGE